MRGAKIVVEGEKLTLVKPGKPKLVDRVREITFNGRVGLARGKQIFYVTDLAVLELTGNGLELREVMPGIDVERDLLANTDARIIVPDDPAPAIVPAEVVTGRDFHLRWADRQ